MHSVIYDEQQQRATGVRVIDAQTKQATEFFEKIIFVNEYVFLLLFLVSHRLNGDSPKKIIPSQFYYNSWQFLLSTMN